MHFDRIFSDAGQWRVRACRHYLCLHTPVGTVSVFRISHVVCALFVMIVSEKARQGPHPTHSLPC